MRRNGGLGGQDQTWQREDLAAALRQGRALDTAVPLPTGCSPARGHSGLPATAEELPAPPPTPACCLSTAGTGPPHPVFTAPCTSQGYIRASYSHRLQPEAPCGCRQHQGCCQGPSCSQAGPGSSAATRSNRRPWAARPQSPSRLFTHSRCTAARALPRPRRSSSSLPAASRLSRGLVTMDTGSRSTLAAGSPAPSKQEPPSARWGRAAGPEQRGCHMSCISPNCRNGNAAAGCLPWVPSGPPPPGLGLANACTKPQSGPFTSTPPQAAAVTWSLAVTDGGNRVTGASPKCPGLKHQPTPWRPRTHLPEGKGI